MLKRKTGVYDSGKIVFLKPDEIYPNPMQAKRVFSKSRSDELSSSIDRYGIISPLLVRRTKKRFELISGARRLNTAKKLCLPRVPCIILNVNRFDASAIALSENLLHYSPDFIEEAESLSRFMTVCSLSVSDAAERLGISPHEIAFKTQLLALGNDILYQIRDLKLSERHARALLLLETNDERLSALEKIAKCKMSDDEAEKYVSMLISRKSGAGKSNIVSIEPRQIIVLKDVRFFLNTLHRAYSLMRSSGVNAELYKNETENDVVLTFKIPKPM